MKAAILSSVPVPEPPRSLAPEVIGAEDVEIRDPHGPVSYILPRTDRSLTGLGRSVQFPVPKSDL